MNTNQKRQFLLLISILAVVVGGGLIYQKRGEDSVRKHMILTTSQVISVETYGRYARQKVTYVLEGERTSENRDDIKYWILKKLRGKNIPVVYDSTNKNVSRILISPNDYKKYGVAYPDSLQWVKDFFKE